MSVLPIPVNTNVTVVLGDGCALQCCAQHCSAQPKEIYLWCPGKMLEMIRANACTWLFERCASVQGEGRGHVHRSGDKGNLARRGIETEDRLHIQWSRGQSHTTALNCSHCYSTTPACRDQQWVSPVVKMGKKQALGQTCFVLFYQGWVEEFMNLN